MGALQAPDSFWVARAAAAAAGAGSAGCSGRATGTTVGFGSFEKTAAPGPGLTSIDATNRRSLLATRGMKRDSPRGSGNSGRRPGAGEKNESLHIYCVRRYHFFSTEVVLNTLAVRRYVA